MHTMIYMSGMRTPATLGPEEASGTVVLVELVELNRVSFRSLSLNMSRNRGRPGEGLAKLPFSHVSAVISNLSSESPLINVLFLTLGPAVSAPAHLFCLGGGNQIVIEQNIWLLPLREKAVLNFLQTQLYFQHYFAADLNAFPYRHKMQRGF